MTVEEELFIVSQVEDHILGALRASRNGSLSALELAGEVWHRSLYASWRTHIKDAIRQLESQGDVGVLAYKDRDRKKKGIEERDLIFLKSGR